MELVNLRSMVSEYLDALAAKKSLEAGFGGMGHNIVVEKASSEMGCLRNLRGATGGSNDWYEPHG
jgi:hypothetical protein